MFIQWTTPGWDQSSIQDPDNSFLCFPKTVHFSWRHSFDLCPWTLWPSSMTFIDSHHPLSLPLIIPFDFHLKPLSRTFAGDQHPWLLLWPSPMIVTNKHCLWPSTMTIIRDDYLQPSPIFILMTIPHDHCSQLSLMTFTITSPMTSAMTITNNHYLWPSLTTFIMPPMTITMTLAMTAEVSIVDISSIWSLEGIVYGNRIDSRT